MQHFLIPCAALEKLKRLTREELKRLNPEQVEAALERLDPAFRLTPDEQQFYDENGYILKQGLVSFEGIEKIQEEINDIHNRMAKQPIEEIGVSWEEFDHPDTPPRIKQLMNIFRTKN